MNNYTAPLRFRAWDTKLAEWSEIFNAVDVDGVPGMVDWDGFNELENLIITQSTGLFDKNGKEIFGGDIVLWNTSIPAQPYGDSPDPGEPRFSMCEVTYHCGRFGCDVKDGGFGDISLHQAFDEFGEPEVIGNVFENPELLEGEA